MDPISRGPEEHGRRDDDARGDDARPDGRYDASPDGGYDARPDSGHEAPRPDGGYEAPRTGGEYEAPRPDRGHDVERAVVSVHEGEPAATGGEAAEPPRPPRVSITPGVPAPAPTPAPAPLPAVAHIKGAGPITPAQPVRTVQLVSGDLLVTVNPVDGSEIERRPPGREHTAPARLTAEERTAVQRAGRPPVPAGPAAPALPLLERGEERAKLAELLGRGRSVRLTGPAGSGRTALIEAVAADCADLAPDGVVRLSGYRRTATELLYELYAAVHRSPLARPDRPELLDRVRDIGAVVVLDDLELGGEALDELLTATPECAYLCAATPDTAVPSPDARLEEVTLGGLGRGSSLELLEHVVERPLTDEEANWAGDLWFESEGLPLRFVQAGALLRQRDQARAGADAVDEFEPFVRPFERTSGEGATAATPAVPGGYDVPLPTLGEGAAPAAPLAARLSEAARATLRFAVALGGEVPHQAHLPALVGDTHADAALGELMSCGLLTPVGGRYRLAAGVAAQLEARGYGDDAVAHAHTAAQHYAWWSGHPSVTPERAATEADAILAAMGPLVPGTEAGHPSAAVLLARSAAPAFLAGLHWGAWERALRAGSEAARMAGEVAEEAYFHHELGVLALCVGNLDRARAELEASIGMRGALADKIGTVAGRRALALVTDREAALAGPKPPGSEAPTVRYAEPLSRAAGLPELPGLSKPSRTGPGQAAGHGTGTGGGSAAGAGLGLGAVPAAGIGSGIGSGAGSGSGSGLGSGPGSGSGENMALVTRRDTPALPPGSGARPAHAAPRSAPPGHSRRPALGGARRNLVAAGAGAVLAAVLGTVVTLGATSDGDPLPPDKVRTEQSTDPDDNNGDDGNPAEQPVDTSTYNPGGVPAGPDSPSPTGPTDSAEPSDSPSSSGTPSDGTSSSPGDSPSASGQPTDPTDEPSDTPTGSSEPPSPSTSVTPPTEEPSGEPSDTDTAPAPSTPQTSVSGPDPSLSEERTVEPGVV
ncbi:ATP-binding protein [Streptomyces sp. JV176]|uniref:ATP-binding protein n=1 Tax=Streptomyces sp. JV176 TaxID=858630 RepID=UPI002E7A707F|nr:ATP-binding protein [Streptomyces sp. JV176]MEE1804667.1 ATP-binding protein [Streptomyces sp. JV176]